MRHKKQYQNTDKHLQPAPVQTVKEYLTLVRD